MIEKFENLKLIPIKDEGVVEIVPIVLKNGKAIFEATGFSYYTFVDTEQVVSEEKEPEQNVPQTTTKPAEVP